MKTFFKKYWFNLIIISIMLVGIFLRMKGLLINPSMWHDESGLAFNIIDKSWGDYFKVLRFHQTAPPFFMILTKFITNLFHAQNNIGTCDLVIRLVPFISSVLSIGVFYLISKEVFKSKGSVAFAMLLFSINNELVNYSYEFKPYCTDMLFVLLIILFFLKLELDKTNYKKLALYSIGLSLAVWFSFVSVFALSAGFITLLAKRKNLKKTVLLYLPIAISGVLYLKFYILNAYVGNSNVMLEFWGNEFVSANLSNFMSLLVSNLRYFFFPSQCTLFIIILMISGIVVLYKEKKYDAINLILLTFLFLTIASMMHLYPFSKRLVLFLAPLFLLLAVKPLDKISLAHKFKSFAISIMFISILTPQLLFAIDKIKTKNINKGEFPREMMVYMAQNIKPTDKIFVNKASNWEFLYYSSFYDLKNELISENLSNKANQEYSDLLNGLKKGNYWFFLPYDYNPDKEIINFVKDWTKENTEVLYTQEATQSALIYAKIK